MLIRNCKKKDIKYFSRKFISQNDSILDVGCANGEAYDIIKSEINEIEYFGLDYAYWERKEISLVESSETKYIKGEAKSLPFSEKSFDIVIMSHVLEHLHNVNEVLSEVNRVMKNDGIILIIVPLQGRTISGLLYKYRNPMNFLLPFLNSVGLIDYVQPGEGHNQFRSYENWEKKISAKLHIKESYTWGGLRMLLYVLLVGYFSFISSLSPIINFPSQPPISASMNWPQNNKRPSIIATFILEKRDTLSN